MQTGQSTPSAHQPESTQAPASTQTKETQPGRPPCCQLVLLSSFHWRGTCASLVDGHHSCTPSFCRMLSLHPQFSQDAFIVPPVFVGCFLCTPSFCRCFHCTPSFCRMLSLYPQFCRMLSWHPQSLQDAFLGACPSLQAPEEPPTHTKATLPLRPQKGLAGPPAHTRPGLGLRLGLSRWEFAFVFQGQPHSALQDLGNDPHSLGSHGMLRLPAPGKQSLRGRGLKRRGRWNQETLL